MKKKLLAILMILTMGIITGCGMSEEEAAEYVQASLDAAYKGEFDKFVEITESTPEGAEAMYEENIVHTMEAAGFADLELSDELTEKYRQLFKDASKNVNYSVGEAVETEDGDYEVTIEIFPTTLFAEVSPEELSEAVGKKIDKMKKYPSDEQIIEITYEELHRLYSEIVKTPEYLEEPVVQKVGVHKNEKGMYYISEEDMILLDSVMFELNNK